jgi:hypothetical protein
VPGANHGQTALAPPGGAGGAAAARGDARADVPDGEAVAALGAAVGAFVGYHASRDPGARAAAARQLLNMCHRTAAMTAPWFAASGAARGAALFRASRAAGGPAAGDAGPAMSMRRFGSLGRYSEPQGRCASGALAPPSTSLLAPPPTAAGMGDTSQAWAASDAANAGSAGAAPPPLLQGAFRRARGRLGDALHPGQVAAAEAFAADAQRRLLAPLPAAANARIRVVASAHTDLEVRERRFPGKARGDWRRCCATATKAPQGTDDSLRLAHNNVPLWAACLSPPAGDALQPAPPGAAAGRRPRAAGAGKG